MVRCPGADEFSLPFTGPDFIRRHNADRDCRGCTRQCARRSHERHSFGLHQRAELAAVRTASAKFDPVQLRDATLYSSAEPFAICAGAIYWFGIGRVVHALSGKRLPQLTGNHPGGFSPGFAGHHVFRYSVGPFK